MAVKLLAAKRFDPVPLDIRETTLTQSANGDQHRHLTVTT